MRTCSVSYLFVFLMLAGCSRSGTAQPSAEPTPAVVSAPTASSDDALVLGDWSTYAEPEGEGLEPEEVVPLNDDRWMRVSAELACAGRIERGDAGAQRAAAARVLHHHRTSAKAVMDYGIAVNVTSGRAHALGERIAAAVERCNVSSSTAVR